MNEPQPQENYECECDKVSHIWLWGILFLVVLLLAMVEW